MHSTGIGGGGVMLVYKRGTKAIETFDYRETAPGKSREDMFVDEPQKSKNGRRLLLEDYLHALSSLSL